LRGSPAGTDAGGTQHGSCLGARSEHPRTSSATALSVGLKHATVLSRTQKHRSVGERPEANTAISLDLEGQLHIERLEAIDEPASLIELRRDVNALLPRVDLPEVILEVMSWEPRFGAAFVAASGGQTRLADLHVTIAACLTAHALNIGYSPIVKKGVPALERDRISHVNQNYLGTETYAPANVWLIAAQAGIALAQAWGGGLVAGIDGMRFIVPVPSIYARPNRKYLGSRHHPREIQRHCHRGNPRAGGWACGA
jgi:Tn3 transposase DDE domain